MKKQKQFRSGLAFRIILSVVLLLVVFSLIIGVIGLMSYRSSFKKEYSVTTYHIADTAATLVNGDSIDSYLSDGENEEYITSAKYLEGYCKRMGVSLIYVIKVDTGDYGRFVSVFNAVDNSVDNSSYTPWELGHKRDTTNDEYRRKYRAIYGGSEYETVYRTTNLKGHHPHITTMVPVKNSDGDVVAILCVQRPMSELNAAVRPYLFRMSYSTLLIVVIVALLSANYLNRYFVVPIKSVSDEATRFARENTQGERLGDISSISEISNLAHSIDTMESDMLLYIDNLTALNAEKERAKAELSIATTIQQNSVPVEFPDSRYFEIYASMTSAKEVGGDFYNFFMTDENHLAIVIGDVSGKGIPAALFMMVTNILLSDRALMGGSPAEILTFVNNNICDHNKAEMFVTLWLGILDLTSGKLTACNAGHDDAGVYRADGSFDWFRTRHGLVAGAMPGIVYKDFEIQLGKGDKIFLYTDGVPEATDADNKMFSMERTLDALNRYADRSPEQIINGVKRRGNGGTQADESGDVLTVAASVENLAAVTDFVNSRLEAMNCPMKTQTQIDVAIDEIFSNIAYYAYGGATGDVTLRLTETDHPRGVALIFSDSGTPYDPLNKPDPDTSLSAEERAVGGLGIFLVKKTMDDVTYEYADGHNILTVTKYF